MKNDWTTRIMVTHAFVWIFGMIYATGDPLTALCSLALSIVVFPTVLGAWVTPLGAPFPRRR